MPGLKIREMSPGEFTLIWPLFQEAVKAGDSFPYLPEITFDEAKAQWFLPNAKVYGAFIEDELVATRYIVPNKAGLGSHVANMGVIVAKHHRGHKIGRHMLEFGITKARELGFKAIQLNLVVSTNIASVMNCLHFEFKIVGILPNAFYYKRERYVDAYVMYRSLE